MAWQAETLKTEPTRKGINKNWLTGGSALFSVAVGLIVLFGWAFNIPELKYILPGFITMKVNTAICFVALGWLTWLLRDREIGRFPLALATVLIVIVSSLSLLTLFEYLLNENFGIDELIFRDPDGITGRFPPGRLAPITSINFLLLTLSLVLANFPNIPRYRISQFLALVALLSSFQALVGYLLGLTYIFGSAFYTQMALHTAATFVVISIGVLVSRSGFGFTDAFSSKKPGGMMAQRMLLAVVIVPLAVRWLSGFGRTAGLYDKDFDTLIQIMGSMTLMAVIVVIAANAMRRSERELERLYELERIARRRAEDANEAKTNFLANMSHEIRTPLGAVLGFSEILASESESDPADKRGLSAAIRRNGEQLLHLIDDILDVSKIETGHLKMNREPISIRNLYSEIHDLTHLRALEKGVELTFQPIDNLPEKAFTDPRRLRQILCNLIYNAIKFTARGGRVLVHGELVDSTLRFLIDDNGIGISPDEAKKLFKPFAQADVSATRNFGGSGLGLALSRRLAQALGGDVRLLKSEKGVGSSFELAVPINAPLISEAVTQKFTPTVVAEAVAPVNNQLHERLAGLKVLLVEDSKDNQQLISRFLRGAGAAIEIANDGIEGIDKALHGAFDIVLMDLQMPRMDGYEAIRRMRAVGYKPPILALTAHALTGDREKSLRAGFNEHLTKPVEKKSLIEAVDRFCHVSGI